MTPVFVSDDFARDAAAVRTAVLASEFATETGPDGGEYSGICRYSVPHWHDRIAEVVGRKITPRLSAFRLNLGGELPHSWVHSDHICAGFASVLYLNTPEQCVGGTAFWRHEALKVDRLPTRGELEAVGANADWYYRMMEREWKDLTYWKQTALVPMRFNRFITYPTSYFHSRFPFEAFGHGPQDGRLIWVCFYDLEGDS